MNVHDPKAFTHRKTALARLCLSCSAQHPYALGKHRAHARNRLHTPSGQHHLPLRHPPAPLATPSVPCDFFANGLFALPASRLLWFHMSALPPPETGAPTARLPPLAYTHSAFERAAHLRPQAADLLEDPRARACLLGGEMVAMRSEGEPYFPVEEARAWSRGKPIFLGLEDEAPRFAFSFDPARVEELEGAGLVVQGLRAIAAQDLLPGPMLGGLACAKALLAWHGRHRFCSNCGTRTQMADSGWRRDCPACGGQHFPRTDPAVIMLVIRGENCLMGRSPHFRPGMYSCLAGFVEPGETFEEAVRRETREEAGIHSARVRYLACQPWPFPMSLMIGCIAEAVSEAIVMDPAELEDVRWFTRDEVVSMVDGTHPEGLFVPGPEAIARHLVQAFLDGETAISHHQPSI